MRIRYLTVVGVFLFIAMFVGLEMRQAADARLIEQTDAQQLGVGRVLRDATDLLALTQNLQTDEGARRGRAWYALHAELSTALAGIGEEASVEMGGAWQELRVATQRLRPLFEALEAAGTASGDAVARENERAALSVQLLAATQRIHALGWDAMTRLIERRGLQLQRAHQFAQAVNAAMGVLMLLMMGTVFWRVLRPLRQLQDAVEALERGELDARSGVRSNDELGQLSQSLDSMALAVQERTTSLAKAHRDLTSLLDALPSMIGYWDRNLINRVANKAYQAWFGVEHSTLPGRRMIDLLGDALFEANRPYVEGVLRGETQIFERAIPRPDGEGWRHSLTYYLPDQQDGEVHGFHVIVHDVSEITESREKLGGVLAENEALLGAIRSHSLFSVTDVEGRILDANSDFCQRCGYALDELLGQTHRIVDSGWHSSDFWAAMWTRILSGDSWRADVCNRARDGELYWTDVIVSPVKGRDGRVVKFVAIAADISSRVRAEQALKESNERLALALDSAGMGVWDFDLVAGTLNWDDGMYRLYGRARRGDQEPYELWSENLHPADRESAEWVLQEAINGDRPFDTQFRIHLPDGKVRHLKANAHVIRDEAGRSLRMIGVNTDITDQVTTAAALLDNEKLLRRVGEMGRIGGWRLDLSTGEVIWSEQTLRIHEVPPDYVPTLATGIEFYAPEYRDVIQQAVELAIATGQPWDLELRLITYTGRSIWVRAQGEVVMESGRAAHLVGAFQDISERRMADERVRGLLESAPDAMVIMDENGLIVLVNSQTEQLFQYERTQLLGQPIEKLLLDATSPLGPAVGRKLMDAANAGSSVEVLELSGLRGNGSVFPVEINLSPLQTADGTLIASSIRDVTTQQRDAQALREAMLAAESASAAKSAFLANMSHEIRTPLNALLGVTHLLGDTGLTPDQQRLVGQAQIAGRSLLGIVNDVLDLAKIEAGEMTLEELLFRPDELLAELQLVYGPQALAKSVRLDTEMAPDVPAWLLGDVARLRQALTNLIGNAIKFTPSGSVKIQVGVVGRQGSGVKLKVSVRDTGIGIAPEVQAQLFRPFSQADISTTRRFGGTGLGLSIVRRIARLMGGDVALSSAPGQGSEFRLEVPMSVPSREQMAAAASNALEVALVDACPEDLLALAGVARALGWRTGQFESVEIMVDAMKRRHRDAQPLPDALIVNCPAPDMAALLPLVAQIGMSMFPPLLVAADGEHAPPIPQPLERMVDQMLVKPVSTSDLFNAVNASITRRNGNAAKAMGSTCHEAMDGHWLKGVRVLVVDDSEVNLEVAKRLLERDGAEVETCINGRDALELLRRNGARFDAVLMDVQMPEMDGLEATRRIRADLGLAALPIIALTAGALTEERRRAMAAGMNEFLTKPLDPQGLVRTVRLVVDNSRQRTLPVTPLEPREGDFSHPLSDAWPVLEGIDAVAAAQRLGGDRQLFVSSLARMLDEYADLMSTDDSEPAGDARAALSARAHKLRGVAGTVGADEVHRAAAVAESELRAPAAPVLPVLQHLARTLRSLGAAAAPLLAAEAAAAAERASAQTELGAEPLTAAQREALLDLLGQNDLSAVEQVEAMAAALQATLGASVAQRLQAAVQALDFQAACRLLAL
jgi:PAS domain S-box-containing protein